eukprot:7249208-Pyramimonas_sp.AAC.1
MQRHFCKVEKGLDTSISGTLQTYSQLPDLLSSVDQHLLKYAPTPLDLQHLMRAFRKGKAPGIDGIPSCVFKIAPHTAV